MCRERSATIPPLRDSQTLLKDENRDVRLYAAEALGKLRAVTTVPALIQALQDPEKEVRECASGALEEIGTREAKAALKALRSRKPADA
jgi:HEAT repeat protein